MSDRATQPLEFLKVKPIPKTQQEVVIYFNEPVADVVSEDLEEGEEREPVAEKETLLEETAEAPRPKTIIKDKRKYATIDRAAVLNRLRENNTFNVKNAKDIVGERERITTPLGEPEIRVKKLEKRVVLNEDKNEVRLISERVDDTVAVDEDDLSELNDILEESKKPTETVAVTEVETAPAVTKKIRKPRLKKATGPEIDLINIDLTTASIRDKLMSERLPKQSEKVIVKAPTYYMNNRKIAVQKLNELFQPYRREIMANESNISCDSRSAGAEFELLTHQKIVRDYLNLYTPYRGLLLYHGLGAGKTCTSIAIAEGMKTDKQIYVLTPASLKMNFFSELKKCGDHLYKKNQFWEFVSIDGKPEYIGILAKSLSLTTEYIREHNGAWLVNIEKEPNFTEKTAEEQKEIDEQLNHMIRSKYVDINYNGLNKNIFNKLTNNNTTNPFDNAVVLIDEAHNFVSRIVNKIKKPTAISYMLYDLLMNATNARIVLLTGTPIINYPNEIGILFNILRGYIKTWTLSVNVKTSDKINTDTILEMFDKEGLKTHDYVEYSGNKLTITRNPFGFVNTKKRGVAKGTKRAVKTGGGISGLFGGYTYNTNKTKTKKRKPSGDTIKDNKTEDYLVGGGDAMDKYNGVKLDEMGNMSDADFQNTVIRILTKHNLEVPKGTIEVKKYKALPDDSQAFLDMFVNTDNGDVKNLDVFQRRILGLTSYFRSAQEQLLPRFVKTAEDEIFHIVKTEMTPYQFGIYEKIRKVEAEQEKKNRKNQKKAQNNPDNDLYKISSTYRIFSRAACNFAFPPGIDRPLPDNASNKEIDENEFNATPLTERQSADQYLDEEDIEEEKAEGVETETVTYQKRIEAALDKLKFNPEVPRETEYLRKEELGEYSPKFVQVLENIQSEENQGLHLIYTQFRTIEGIGILKLILEANGFAEFKIKKVSDNWEIVEDAKDAGKPKFVLYTGTEGAEEKEIVRNIYNSTWDFVPPNIATRLREQGENNFYGDIIKVFMITSSGAEGINLKNTRFVHVIEPYWHMVRIEQVIGRARRICSHQDLPENLRTVKVFLYISTLSEEQKTSEKNIELRIRDISKLDAKTPVTTDEALFETASLKDKINRQILKAVKESAVDCSLYSTKNKDEPLVCYGFGKIESNQFGSHPSFEQDRGEKKDLNVKTISWQARKFAYKGKDYALNEDTNEVFDYDSYLLSRESGAELVLLGHLVRSGKGYKMELL